MNDLTSTDQQQFRWGRTHWIALLVLCGVQLLEAIDITVANVALPTIKHELSFSSSSLPWVLNAYAVAFGGFLLLGGRAGDLLGRRRVLLAGVAVFTAASLASALAQSPVMLIASRAAQGLAAAFSSPMTLGMLASIFPQGSARNRAVSLWGMTAGVSASLGLVLGGLLVSGPGWRWIFLVNVPIGALILVCGGRFLPGDGIRARVRNFDAAGAISATAGLGLLAYAVVQTGSHPWGSAQTVAPLAAAVLLVAFFAYNEARLATQPLIPHGLLRNRPVAAANLVSALLGSGLWAMFYFVALYQQEVLHHSPLQTGLLMVPLTAVLIIVSGVGPLLVKTIGVRYSTTLGAAIATVGLAMFAASSPTAGAWTNIIAPSLVLSTGFGLMFVPLTIAAVAGVAHTEVGIASALLTTTRQVAGALGLAIIATLASRHTTQLLHAGTPLRGALSGGFDLGFAIAAGLMAITALAALILMPDHGRGQQIDITALVTAGASPQIPQQTRRETKP